jgi:hypothetical protein
MVNDLAGRFQEEEDDRRFIFLIFARISNGRLEIIWQYSKNIHKRKTVQKLLDACMQDLRSMAYFENDEVSENRPEGSGQSGERLNEVFTES